VPVFSREARITHHAKSSWFLQANMEVLLPHKGNPISQTYLWVLRLPTPHPLLGSWWWSSTLKLGRFSTLRIAGTHLREFMTESF
jgi:hypothetical protein